MCQKTVCNIKFIMTLRYIFGISQIPKKSPRMRLFCKLFSLFIAFSITSAMYCYSKVTNPISKYGACIEYFTYVLVSIQTSDKYFHKYNKSLIGIDNLPGASIIFKQLSVFLTILAISFLIINVYGICTFCYEYSKVCFSREVIGLFALAVIGYAIDNCRLTFIIAFTLLYCRVKLIRHSLEADIRCLQNRFSVNKYIQKYEMLLQSLEWIEYPLKLLIAIYLLYLAELLSVDLLSIVFFLKNNDESILKMVWFILNSFRPVLALLIGSIALDLTTDNINEIKVILIEKRIIAVNERQRSEVNHILRLLEHRPLNYTVYRAVPLTAYMTLSVVSFVIINTMAVYQMKRYFT